MDLKMKELRVKRGLKQEEVAQRADMPLRRYGSYERGERVISLPDAAIIADVLNCSLDELAGRQWSGATLVGNEQKLVDDYRATHDYFKPEIGAYAEDQARRHPKNQADSNPSQTPGEVSA